MSTKCQLISIASCSSKHLTLCTLQRFSPQHHMSAFMIQWNWCKILHINEANFCVFCNLSFHLLCGFFILCTNRNINLQLRLSAGGTYNDGTVIFQQELEHIGLGKSIQTRRIVQQLYDLLAAKFPDITPECLHDTLHLGKTGAAVELIAMQRVQAVAIGLVQFIQLVQQADTLSRIIAEHFANHISTVYTVLVADVAASQVAITFLKTEYIAVCRA